MNHKQRYPRGQSTIGWKVTLLFPFAVFCISGEASAQNTIRVPQDKPTIQAGINAAANGDIVLVASGKYTENINFDGKDITVTSSGGAASTIIDAGGNGVVVIFENGESSQAVLNGFTIQNAGPGTGSEPVQSDGILVQNADPTITNNIITSNRGYGIQLGEDGSALIQGNTISNTTTQYDPAQDYGCDYDDGSGIDVEGVSASGSTVIEDNTIQDNVAHCGGGGIRIGYGGVPYILNNRILYNRTLGSDGGGIYMFNGTQVLIVQNLIAGNIAASMGGGVGIDAFSEIDGAPGPVNSYLVNNTIVGNTISPNPDISGPELIDGSQVGFPGYVSQTGLYNNLIISGDTYHAVACDPLYSYLSKTPPVITASDVYSYTGNEFGGWCTAQAGTSASVYQYISANPIFVAEGSEFFHLALGSPALATGDPAAPELPATDIDGVPRVQTGASGATVDMGIYEGAAPSSAMGTPAFTIRVSPATLTLSNTAEYGVAAMTTVTIMPSGGFLGVVSLQCSELPTAISTVCNFGSENLGAAGDNTPLTATLIVEATPATAQIQVPPRPRVRRVSGVWAVLLFLPLGLGWFGRSRWFRGQVSAISAFAVMLLLIAIWVPACGGGSSVTTGGGDGGSGGGGNPSYSFTVVATATGNAHGTQSATVTFTISN
jgi:parallel beta-helix repeat protein